jgi:PIN domain nuclease of toxin-antitoxin system
VRVLLDTVTLIFAIETPRRLSRRARAVFAPRYAREVSALSFSEIAMKVRTGKLTLTPGKLEQALDEMEIRVLPYTREHALKLFELPWRHTDPFDRMILAQALEEEIPVVTADEVFGRYEGVRVIW